jgi:LysR family transcriptional regulator for metE and metH
LVRQAELTAVILMLVAANKGVSVLPDWVIQSAELSPDLVTRPITAQGLTRQLYAAVRTSQSSTPFISRFIELSRQGQLYAKPQPLAR